MLEDFLRINKIDARIHFMPQGTKTAEQAERAMVNSGLVIVKSIILMDSNSIPLLVVLRGQDKVDFRKIKEITGTKDVRLAEPYEVFKITGYEVGGVPPISIYGVRTIIDIHASKLSEIICGGGTQNHLLQIKMKTVIENNEECEIKDVKKD